MNLDSILKATWEAEESDETRQQFVDGFMLIQPLLVGLQRNLDKQLVINCRSPGTPNEVLTQITMYSVQCAVLTSIMEFFNSGVE